MNKLFFSHKGLNKLLIFQNLLNNLFFHKKTIAPPPGIKWSAPNVQYVLCNQRVGVYKKQAISGLNERQPYVRQFTLNIMFSVDWLSGGAGRGLASERPRGPPRRARSAPGPARGALP